MERKIVKKEEMEIPKVIIDYKYTRDKQEKEDKLITHGGKPIQAVKDEQSGYLYAHSINNLNR